MPPLDLQADNFCSDFPLLYVKASYRDRQLEAPWAGTAGVEVEYAIASLLFWDVAVAADDDVKPGSARFQVQLRKIVKHVD